MDRYLTEFLVQQFKSDDSSELEVKQHAIGTLSGSLDDADILALRN